MASKKRVRIPQAVTDRLVLDSAFRCCVCKEVTRSGQIHHIDSDPSNNDDKNLAYLCGNCHGLAHSQNDMGQNLTPERLRKAKESWEAEVRSRISVALSSQTLGTLWTYHNVDKLLPLASHLGLILSECEHYEYLREVGDIASSGHPVERETGVERFHTNFPSMYTNASAPRQLNGYLSSIVENIVKASPPIIADAIWSVGAIRKYVVTGTLLFCVRAFYFSPIDCSEQGELRLAYTFAKRVRLELHVDTKYMFGSSAQGAFYKGHGVCACLCLVSGVKSTDEGVLISASPLSLGYGMSREKCDDASPFPPPMRYRKH